MQFDVEIKTTALDVGSKPAGFTSCVDGPRQYCVRQRIFGAQVDISLVGADGEAGNSQRLYQAEGIAFHEHAIGERTAVAFIRVTGDVLLFALGVGNGAPLDARRETGTAAAPQAGFGHGVYNGIGAHVPGFLERLESLVQQKIIERQCFSQATTPERPPVLTDQVGNFTNRPQPFRVVTALE